MCAAMLRRLRAGSSGAASPKNRKKPAKMGNFSEKPKKTVEIGCFPIDFAHAKAAL